MNKLNKIKEQIILKNGVRQTKISVSRPDKKILITPKDVMQITKQIFNEVSAGADDFKIFIRSYGPTRQFTFNVDEMGNIINYDDFESYFEGTVSQVTELINAGLLQIYVQIYK